MERSGAGLGRAGEGAGKLEQLRKVPKIPGGGGPPEGAGLEMTPLVTPTRREGRQVGAGLWTSAAGLWAEGQPDPGKPQLGLGPAPPSRTGSGDSRIFNGRERLLVRAQAGLPPPLPLPLPHLEQPWDFLP